MATYNPFAKKVTLHGLHLSPYVRAVYHTAILLGDEVELVDAMPGALPENFKKEKNPFGQIPVAEVDGLTLFESGPIMRYLAHDTQLFPTSRPRDSAKIDVAMTSAGSHASKFLAPFYQKVIGPAFMGKPVPADDVLAAATAEQDEKLTVLNDAFFPGPGPYVFGFSKETLADVNLFAVLSNAVETGNASLDSFPALKKWYYMFRGLESTRVAYVPFYTFLKEKLNLPVAEADLIAPETTVPVTAAPLFSPGDSRVRYAAHVPEWTDRYPSWANRCVDRPLLRESHHHYEGRGMSMYPRSIHAPLGHYDARVRINARHDPYAYPRGGF